MSVPKPPFHSVAEELLYNIYIKLSGASPVANYLTKEDIDTFAKLSALLTDAQLLKLEDLVYNGASPSNIAVGGLQAGTVLTGKSIKQILEEILVAYLVPLFTAFQINGQPTQLEVGEVITIGNKTFSWATSNNANIQPNSIVIRDETAGVDLATNLANDGIEIINFPVEISFNAPGSRIFKIKATNTKNIVFQRDFVVNANYRRFYGTPSFVPEESPQVRALGNFTYGNTFSINIPQGKTIIAFAYEATRHDILDSSVKYVEGFNSNVGNTFTKYLFGVEDAAGNIVAYKIYVSQLGGAFAGNATYNVTIP